MSLCNLWARNFTPVVGIGSGTVTNDGGDLVLQAGTYGPGIVKLENIGVGATVTWRFKSSHGSEAIGIPFRIEYRNANQSDTQGGFVFADGYWTATHSVNPAIGAPSQISLYADNRTSVLYPGQDLRLSEICGVIGTTLPSSLDELTGEPPEVVVVQVPGAIRMFVKSDTRYIEHRLLRTDDPVNNCFCWSWQGSWTVKRIATAAECSFARLAQWITGENTLVIGQNGKADFMGGPTHGDQRDDGPNDYAHLLIDGVQQPIDGVTFYRCQTAELVTRSHLVEVGVGPPYNPLVDVTTSHLVDVRGALTTRHYPLTIVQDFTINAFYAAMLAVDRHESADPTQPLVTHWAARDSRGWALEDVSNTLMTPIHGPAKKVKYWGDFGNIEVDSLGPLPINDFFIQSNNSVGPKAYFNVSAALYPVVVGEVRDISHEYRINALSQ